MRFRSWSAYRALPSWLTGSESKCAQVPPPSVLLNRPPFSEAAIIFRWSSGLIDRFSTRPPMNVPALALVGPRLTTSGGGRIAASAAREPAATTLTATPPTATEARSNGTDNTAASRRRRGRPPGPMGTFRTVPTSFPLQRPKNRHALSLIASTRDLHNTERGRADLAFVQG